MSRSIEIDIDEERQRFLEDIGRDLYKNIDSNDIYGKYKALYNTYQHINGKLISSDFKPVSPGPNVSQNELTELENELAVFYLTYRSIGDAFALSMAQMFRG
ncbi:MAG: hypothetical protein Q7S56_00435 [Nanoarchaeota archaeon]|nr:hypothetical protein [Nanoarchaeota archaeon]